MTTTLIDDAGLAEVIGGDTATAEQVAIWRRAYNWPCVKFGRQVRYTEEHVQEILRMQEHRTGPTPKAIAAKKTGVIPGQTARSARKRAS